MSLELLELGANFLGTMFGRSAKKKEHQLYQQSLRQAQRQFDQQMDQSVFRRVEDAKRAGVHPLFALGASVGASPTASVGAIPRGSGMEQGLERIAQTLGHIRVNRAAAARDEAEAALMDSQRKRVEQEMLERRKPTTFPYKHGNPKDPMGEAEFIQPQVMKHRPGEPGVEAGDRPGNIRVMTKDGRTVDIPSPELGLDEIAQLDFLYQRAVHYGTDVIESYLRKNRKLAKAFREIWQHSGGRPQR